LSFSTNPRRALFGVGCLKLRDPHAVLADFAKLRKTYKFNRKLRWADVGSYSEPYVEFTKQTALMLATMPTPNLAAFSSI
jgi:hypothetical protein